MALVPTAVWAEFERRAALMAGAGVNIGLIVWAVRRRGDFDLPPTVLSRGIRWACVLVGWVLWSWPWVWAPAWARGGALASLLMFWWPNYSVRLARLAERLFGWPPSPEVVLPAWARRRDNGHLQVPWRREKRDPAKPLGL